MKKQFRDHFQVFNDDTYTSRSKFPSAEEAERVLQILATRYHIMARAFTIHPCEDAQYYFLSVKADLLPTGIALPGDKQLQEAIEVGGRAILYLDGTNVIIVDRIGERFLVRYSYSWIMNRFWWQEWHESTDSVEAMIVAAHGGYLPHNWRAGKIQQESETTQ